MKRIILILIFLTLLGCSHSTKELMIPPDETSTIELMEESRKSSENAEKIKSRKMKKRFTRHGIKVATTCIDKAPKFPGCYYYRAVNTGLYYKVKVIGYQRGLKKMIKDSKMVLKLDPDFAYGGAYRILAQIYTHVPLTAARVGDITRNLELAKEYLEKSKQIAPDYPENSLYLSEVLLDLGETKKASLELQLTHQLMPDWRKSPDYTSWKKLANKLKKELKKQEKRR